LVDAARIAATFHLDPVAVLDEPDAFKRRVRLAAALVVAEDNKPPE
jgi:hypothetical protein